MLMFHGRSQPSRLINSSSSLLSLAFTKSSITSTCHLSRSFCLNRTKHFQSNTLRSRISTLQLHHLSSIQTQINNITIVRCFSTNNDNYTNDTILPFQFFATLVAAVSILSSSTMLYNSTQYEHNQKNSITMCEEAVNREQLVNKTSSGSNNNKTEIVVKEQDENEELFYGLFPKRQLYQPKVQYPLWDENWDGLQPKLTGDNDVDRQATRHIRKNGITKHIILVRHGQYDETYKQDDKRILTPLGISQAHYTGQRLQQLIMSISNNNNNTDTNNESSIVTATGCTIQTKGCATPCNIRTIRVSCLTRAKETADIISAYLVQPPSTQEQHEHQVQYISDGDANLNEGRPCHTIPPMSGTADKKLIAITDEQHPRIEKAFQTYFYRNTNTIPTLKNIPSSSSPDSTTTTTDDISSKSSTFDEKHEFEIIVCHANVIRYFLCRYVLVVMTVVCVFFFSFS
jgi:serine/threonine-protein phosphatase PGAM5